MGKIINLWRGHNIKLPGVAQKRVTEVDPPNTFSVKPIDYKGLSPIPKLLIEKGSEVKAGDSLFYDKGNEDVKFTAPVSGEVAEIIRGPKRRIEEIVILADKEVKFKDFGKSDIDKIGTKEVKVKMLESGVWTYLIQRPFGIVADPNSTPKNIYISAYDTAPLAADVNYLLEGNEKAFQAGVNALNKLTDGKVHITFLHEYGPSKKIEHTHNVEDHYITGKCLHPAGNVGVQIHHIDPINKGDVVWTINPSDVVVVGRLFLDGKYNTERLVAIAGPEVKNPGYYKTYQGACIENIVKHAGLKNDHVRYISGNVLTGRRIEHNGHLGSSDRTITILEEGDKYEFMGWQFPTTPRPSISRTFLSTWFNIFGIDFDYKVSTNLRGEKRAYVVSGQYEKVLPMDIYPVHLVKSIMYGDFEEMEGLGLYEVLEEDLALCEFVCTSKINVQELIREGLDTLRIEG